MGGNAMSIPRETVRHSAGYAEGAKAVREGRYTVAEVAFQRVFREHPGFAFWQTLLSACFGPTQDDALADGEAARETAHDEGQAEQHRCHPSDGTESKDDAAAAAAGTASRDTVSYARSAPAARGAVRLVQLPLDGELEAIVDFVRLAANIVLLYLESPPDERNRAIAMLYCELVCIHTELLLHLLTLHETQGPATARARPAAVDGSSGVRGGGPSRQTSPTGGGPFASVAAAASETVTLLVDVGEMDEDGADAPELSLGEARGKRARDKAAGGASTAGDKETKSEEARARVLLLLGQQMRYYWISCLTLYSVLALPYAMRLRSTHGGEERQRTRILTSCLENCRAVQGHLLRFAGTHASNYINEVVLRHMPRSALRDLRPTPDTESRSAATDDETMTQVSDNTRSTGRTATARRGKSTTASSAGNAFRTTATTAAASTKHSSHGFHLFSILTDRTLGGQLTFLQLARRMWPTEPLQLPLTNVLPVRLVLVAHRTAETSSSSNNNNTSGGDEGKDGDDARAGEAASRHSDAANDDDAAGPRAASSPPHCAAHTSPSPPHTGSSDAPRTASSPRQTGDDDDDAAFARTTLATLRSPAERLTYLYLGFTLTATPCLVPGGTASLMTRSLPDSYTPLHPDAEMVLIVRPPVRAARRRSGPGAETGGATYRVVRDLDELAAAANGEDGGSGAQGNRNGGNDDDKSANTAAAAAAAAKKTSVWARMRAALRVQPDSWHSLRPYLSPPLNLDLRLQDYRTLLTLCAEENFLLSLPVALLMTTINSFMYGESASSLFGFAALSTVEELYGTESLLYQFIRREVFNSCSEVALSRLLTAI